MADTNQQRSRHFHTTRRLGQDGTSKPVDEAVPDETATSDSEEPQEDIPEVKELKERLETANQRVEKLEAEKERILRAAAELQNVQKSLQKDIKKANEFGIQKFAESLLTVADNLKLSLEKSKAMVDAEPEDSPMAALYQGVVLTEKSLIQAFSRHQIEMFQSLGKPFDPEIHDGQFELEHPEFEPGSVGEVLSEGYKLKDRVIRPARVGTVKKPAAP